MNKKAKMLFRAGLSIAILLILIMFSQISLSEEQNQFNDTSTEKNFSGSGEWSNLTYIKLPKYSSIINATLNLTGIQTPLINSTDDTEDAYSSSVTNCVDVASAVDENYTTYGRSDNGVTCDIVINYTKPSDVASATWQVKHGNINSGVAARIGECRNRTSGDYIQLFFVNAESTITANYSVESECLLENNVEFRVRLDTASASIDSALYEETAIWQIGNVYPSNVTLDVGDDGDVEFNQTGELTTKEIVGGDLCIGTLDCSNFSTNESCNNCSQCNWTESAGTPDWTTNTCSDVFGIDCDGQDGTNAMFDTDCTAGGGWDTAAEVEYAGINATEVNVGDNLNVTCQVSTIVGGTNNCYWYIYYRNESSVNFADWGTAIANGQVDCDSGAVNVSTTITADNVTGQHQVRCGLQIGTADADGCANTDSGGPGTSEAENNDVNFTVLGSGASCTNNGGGSCSSCDSVECVNGNCSDVGCSYTGEIKSEIISFLSACTPDTEGFCYLPLNISAINGIVQIGAVNITYIEVPRITILSPPNNTVTSNSHLEINYTVADTNLDSCWWTNNTGTTNTTLTCGDNVTGQTWEEGATTVTIYANDTSNNKNSSSVTFSIDSIFPEINITFPQNITYNINISALNYTFTETNPDSCWYSIDDGTTNTTLTCGDNVTGLTSIEGSNIWTVYINDTLGQANSSSATFFKDSIFPSVNIIHPENISYSGIQTGLNYTASDTNLQACWYSTDGGATNITATCGQNITGLNSGQGSSTWILYANDTLNNINSTDVTFFVDSIYPLINYTTGTPDDGSNQTSTSIFVNVTATEINEDAIIFLLYNSTGEVNSTQFTDGTRSINFTSLSDETYSFNVTINDSVGNTNTTETRNIIIDSTFPLISYGFGTELDFSNISRNNIFINVSVTEINEVNITFLLYNSTGEVNSTTFTDLTRLINFTNLLDEDYTFNVTIVDIVNQINTTETRSIRVDTTNPNGTLLNPPNNTLTTNLSNNFTINISDNLGIKNATLNIYNSTGDLINQTITDFAVHTVGQVVGVVVTLADGVYTWFYDLFDWSGNSFTTENNTLTIDTVAPSLTLVIPSALEVFTINTSIPLNFTVSDLTTSVDSCWFNIDNGVNNTIVACQNTTFGTDYGSHTINIFANDSVNNVANDSNSFNVNALPFDWIISVEETIQHDGFEEVRVDWTHLDNWTINSSTPQNWTNVSKTYSLPTSCSDVLIFIDGSDVTSTDLVNNTLCDYTVRRNATLQASDSTLLTINYTTAPVTSSEGSWIASNKEIFKKTKWRNTLTLSNPSTLNYTNITINITTDSQAINTSILIQNSSPTTFSHDFQQSDGNVNWTTPLINSLENQVYTIDYNTTEINLTAINYTVTGAQTIEFYNITVSANSSRIITSVYAFTNFTESSVVSHRLYKCSDSFDNCTEEITARVDVNFDDLDSDGADDFVEWFVTSLNQTQLYQLQLNKGVPVEVTTNQEILNAPIRPFDNINWQTTVTMYNPNPFATEIVEKYEFPLGVRSVELGGVGKNLQFDPFGILQPFITIIDADDTDHLTSVYLAPGQTKTFIITYTTDSVTVSAQNYFPDHFTVGENAKISKVLIIKNQADDDIEDVEHRVPIDYGEDLVLCSGEKTNGCDDDTDANETLDDQNVVKGEYKLEIDEMDANEVLTYTITYYVPTVNLASLEEGKRAIDGVLTNFVKYEFLSIAPFSMDDVRYESEVETTFVIDIWECRPSGVCDIPLPHLEPLEIKLGSFGSGERKTAYLWYLPDIISIKEETPQGFLRRLWNSILDFGTHFTIDKDAWYYYLVAWFGVEDSEGNIIITTGRILLVVGGLVVIIALTIWFIIRRNNKKRKREERVVNLVQNRMGARKV